MSELRLNVLTNEWVILAPVRSERPSDLARARPPRTRRHHAPGCPFCPGNEDQSVETDRLVGPDGRWRVRTVLNKFPALAHGEGGRCCTRTCGGLRQRVGAYGIHEVIIDTRRHDLSVAERSVGDVEALLRAYRARYRAHAPNPALAQLVVFKNFGEDAGASLAHPHSQLIAAPVISSQILERLALFKRHREVHGTCLACDVLADELADGARILHQSRAFVAFTPWAALSPFHTWIMPRQHAAHFGDLGDDDVVDLAQTLRRVLRMLHFGLGDPQYNYVIRSAPLRHGDDGTHWYLSIVPRVSKRAGFEFGSGMYINPTWPDDAAAFLRGVTLPEDPPTA